MLLTISVISLIIGIVIGFSICSYCMKYIIKAKTDMEMLDWFRKVRIK